MRPMTRAIWIDPASAVPHAGQTGWAWPDARHDDPTSAAFLAWLFQPDGEEAAYYCAVEDLRLERRQAGA